MTKLTLLCLSFFVVSSVGQLFEDRRCQCICPSPDSVFNNSSSNQRSLFRDNIPPNKCNCYGLIVPRLGEILKGREIQYCQQCECKYEKRNTTIIMLVVIIVLWVITLLSVYMVFLVLLDAMFNSMVNNRNIDNHEINDEESRTLLMLDDYEMED